MFYFKNLQDDSLKGETPGLMANITDTEDILTLILDPQLMAKISVLDPFLLDPYFTFGDFGVPLLHSVSVGSQTGNKYNYLTNISKIF